MEGDFWIWRQITGVENAERLSIPELRTILQIWREQKEKLYDKTAYNSFMEKWIRRWSIETGILERLYDISPGATEILVEQGFYASLIPHGDTDRAAEEVVEILNDHFEAHDFLMDFIGGTRDLSVSWIKELHQLLTRHQKYSSGMDMQGHTIRVPLIKGDWKNFPNNPISPQGKKIVYCPPEQVASEMDKLVELYNNIPVKFPEVRSAWLHHRFTQIHPFQDGNGRVARCLANLDFIKGGGFPVVIQRDDRWKYLDALAEADSGDLTKLINLFYLFQKKAFLQAISISQETISQEADLEAILEAAKDRVRTRKQTQKQKTDEISERLKVFSLEFLSEKALYIQQSMRQEIRTISAKAVGNTQEENHWYKRQTLGSAKIFNYEVDFYEHRYWSKLTFRDGNPSNFIVLFHQVGRPSQGTGVAVSLIEFINEPGNFICCANEPFIYTYKSEFEEIKSSFSEWLNQSFLVAIQEWQKRL